MTNQALPNELIQMILGYKSQTALEDRIDQCNGGPAYFAMIKNDEIRLFFTDPFIENYHSSMFPVLLRAFANYCTKVEAMWNIWPEFSTMIRSIHTIVENPHYCISSVLELMCENDLLTDAEQQQLSVPDLKLRYLALLNASTDHDSDTDTD